MKKIFTLFSALGIMLASSLQAQDWTKELVSLNPDVIDSVVVIKDTVWKKAWRRVSATGRFLKVINRLVKMAPDATATVPR